MWTHTERASEANEYAVTSHAERHARGKVGRPDQRSPGKRVVLHVRRGNGSDREQRSTVWSLGPASDRRCHIDSRDRTERIGSTKFFSLTRVSRSDVLHRDDTQDGRCVRA